MVPLIGAASHQMRAAYGRFSDDDAAGFGPSRAASCGFGQASPVSFSIAATKLQSVRCRTKWITSPPFSQRRQFQTCLLVLTLNRSLFGPLLPQTGQGPTYSPPPARVSLAP